MTASVLDLTAGFVGWLLQSSLEACLLIALILAVQAVFRNWLSAGWKHALWLLLLVHLLAPWSPSSAWSVYNLFPAVRSYAFRSTSPTPLHEPDNANAVGTPTVFVELPTATSFDGAGPTSTTSSESRRLPVQIVAGCFWLVGSLTLGGLILWRSVALARTVRRRHLVTEAEVEGLIEQCKRRIGCRRGVRVLETSGVSGPALFGIARPCVLLPSGTIRTMDRKRLRHVFLHELAHLKRHDLAINCVATVLQVMHWFNPLIWYALRRMRTDRELACDALVLARLSTEESEEYGRTLVYLFERFRRCRSVVLAADFFGGKSLIRRRVEMIANFNKNAGSSRAIALAMMSVLACVALTKAQDGADAPKDEVNLFASGVDASTDKANLIVPGVGVGPYKLGMSRDDVLKKLGKPKLVYWGGDLVFREGEEYSLDDLPTRHRMHFGKIEFEINYKEVHKILVQNPSRRLANGVGVGDTEQTITRAFGKDFHRDGCSLDYASKGIEFRFENDDAKVNEIRVVRALQRQTIVPGVGIGPYTLGMSKDEVLKRLGKPLLIYLGGNQYTLDNLPANAPYRLHFGHITCEIKDDAVRRVSAHSPIYRFADGWGVGDPEDKIFQVFGRQRDKDSSWIFFDDKGVNFQIDTEKKTVDEINVYRAERE
jgi:beta-lactamase regulating signal transducer with metallopeptidase domain